MSNHRIIKNLPVERWAEYKKIRLMSLKDDPDAFSATYKEESDWSDQKWEDNLATKDLFFIEHESEIVGMSSVHFYTKPRFNHNAYMQALYVNKNYRGRGFATLLIQEVIDDIKKNSNVKNIISEIFESQESSILLHKKVGFKEVGRIEAFVNNKGIYSDNIYMQMSL